PKILRRLLLLARDRNGTRLVQRRRPRRLRRPEHGPAPGPRHALHDSLPRPRRACRSAPGATGTPSAHGVVGTGDVELELADDLGLVRQQRPLGDAEAHHRPPSARAYSQAFTEPLAAEDLGELAARPRRSHADAPFALRGIDPELARLAHGLTH